MEPQTLTVKDFCELFRIGRSTLYKILAHNEGLETFTIGRRRLITVRSAEAFLEKRAAKKPFDGRKL